MNVVDPILFQAKYQPEAPALCAQGVDVISYARLVAQMNNVARRALASGLKRGSVAALSIEQPMLHAAVILGLTQAGIIPVSVAMYKPPAGLQIDAVLSNTNYPYAPAARHLAVDHSWLMGDGAPIERTRAPQSESDDICRIVLTSGTAGDPKAVALSHTMVTARNARFEYVLGNRFPTFSRVYLLMGLAAALGYQFLIYLLGRGGTVFFRGEDVENTLRAFEVFRIQGMLATPTTLSELLKLCDRHPSIDIHLDTIVSGGSLLPRALVERIRPRLCAHLVTGYGSTETAISATAPAHRIASVEGAAGYVTPGMRFEIVDEADRSLPAGSEGIVRIASEFAVDRYIDDPVESADVFRDGWFYPGDIGALTPDNLLIISGRRNSVLNAGGGKFSAEKVEATLTSFKGVSEAAVFMATSALGVEEVWAGIVCGEKVDSESLRAHCRPRMPAVFVPAHIVTLDALPINATGKVDRPRLKQMVLSSARS
ncbi:MAG TPA: class I adenylate-forming enzyme family protein [Xanthobacteraceae bacterium]|jgi:acyl-CoA synthetase (AMP-forming)/AMP-acid ligase II|nr:class I adenylate-forming enzyme family protein [Xanthobacteraceae bacterium]